MLAPPLGAFQDRITAELTADTISCSCPHPADADRLYLPPGILCCADCRELAWHAASLHTAECAECAIWFRADDPAAATCWVAGRVLVMALICEVRREREPGGRLELIHRPGRGGDC